MAHVLLLEPDAFLADIYMQALASRGHSSQLVVAAQDAVFAVDDQRPDVIVVELQLVAHSGIEFLYELRSYDEWQAIPVIIHSCIPPSEFSSSMHLLTGKLGVAQYLYKPQTSLSQLLRSVAAAVAVSV